MTEATALKFNRGDYSTLGPGQTVEYKSPFGETLAYIDYNEDQTRAAVTVFTPSTGGERRYAERPAGKAQMIAINHLNRQGYAPGDVEDAGNVTAEADAARAAARGDAAPAADPADVEDAAAVELPLPQPAAAYVPAATSPAPPQPGESAGDWQGRVQAHFADPVDVEPQPEFRSVAEAADAILGEPADDIVRHWISGRGVIYQLHLRAVVPAAETAEALRDFVANDAHGYTASRDGRIWLWSGHAWNCGYAVVLPA
jgi:hypothetical protein